MGPANGLRNALTCCSPMRPLPPRQVDVTVNNMLACLNTKLLADYAAIDPRLSQLVRCGAAVVWPAVGACCNGWHGPPPPACTTVGLPWR